MIQDIEITAGVIVGFSILFLLTLLIGPVIDRAIRHRRLVRTHGVQRAHLLRALDRASRV